MEVDMFKPTNEQLERAKRAKEIFNDEIFQESINRLEEHYTKAWKSTKKTDSETREYAYMMVQCVQELQSYFWAIMDIEPLEERGR